MASAAPGAAAVSVVAGNGVVGFANGPARTAEFDNPAGIAVDSTGNVYIADSSNARIRLIPAGSHTVSTFAGDGRTGFVNGPAAGAEFAYPAGIAVDSTGNLYVADTANNEIRVIAATSHIVSTLAGDRRRGFADGAASKAEFNTPTGVAVDSLGNVYVADAGNDRIREIAAGSHTVSTLAGGSRAGFANGEARAARFDHPLAIAVDPAGNIYVADVHNDRIRRIAAKSHSVSTLAGNGLRGFADGTESNAEFGLPVGIAVDNESEVYVADISNARIRLIDTGSHTVSTLAGNGKRGFVDGSTQRAEFRGPYAIAVDAKGKIYVADLLDQRIRTITRGT